MKQQSNKTEADLEGCAAQEVPETIRSMPTPLVKAVPLVMTVLETVRYGARPRPEREAPEDWMTISQEAEMSW